MEHLPPQSIRMLAPEVQDAGALMERVHVDAANTLLQNLVAAINPTAAMPAWLLAPPRTAELNAAPQRWAPNSEHLRTLSQQLDVLIEAMATPRHEGSVRALVLAALPEWAQKTAKTDEIGNLWVEFGNPDTEATVFIAHMDEVGWEISSIAEDGTLTLVNVGGVVRSAWEGQPAILQLDSGSAASSLAQPEMLRGVFLSRGTASTRDPEAMYAWFGMDAAGLAAAGVTPGMGITLYKEGHRMGPWRFTGRSMDDRVGVTALLRALQQIDPTQVPNRIIFAWSVQEESGLHGAAELARRFGLQTRRAYSIDTFVSSDTPLESPHFAFAPLGQGPVLRSIESSSIATPYELQRNKSIAAAAGIAAQIGHTQGGTDGTRFTFYGAPNAGLSWPGRYSHSPAELADLRDIAQLAELITAMLNAPLVLE